MVWPCPCLVFDSPSTGPPLTLLIKHDLDAPVYILPPSTRPDSCNGHRKVSNALPEPDRSRPTRTAIPLLFPIGCVPFFSGLLGLDPCASAFPRSGVRSHRTLGVLQSRSLRPLNPLCSPSRPARRTGRNSQPVPRPGPIHVTEDHNEEYEVDVIIDLHIYKGKLQYLVHWKGYDESERTWKSVSNLKNSPEVVEQFHQSHPSTPWHLQMTQVDFTSLFSMMPGNLCDPFPTFCRLESNT